MNKSWIGLTVALTTAACGSPATTQFRLTSDTGAHVFVATATGVGTFSARSLQQAVALPDAVLSPDRDTAFVAAGDRLQVVDPLTGAVKARLDLPPELRPRVASPTGDLIALGHAGQRSPYELPEGRSSTDLAVVEGATAAVPRQYRLRGNFEPEAFSTDERWLYLIEYLPAQDPERYAVRQMKLATGRVFPVGARVKQPAPETMRGTGRKQAYAPDEDILYTLYTKQGLNTAHGLSHAQPHRAGDVHAFVHVLNLDQGWAHCVDLPKNFGNGEAPADGLAVSPDGGAVYVVDASKGLIGEIDTRRLRVTRTHQVDVEDMIGSELSAEVSRAGDVLAVGGARTVVAFDTATFEPTWSHDMDWTVTGVALSDDGTFVLVGQGDEVTILDVATGAERASVAAPGVEEVDYVPSEDLG